MYRSGTFEIDAYLSDPLEDIIIEVFTPPGGVHVSLFK